MLVSVNKIGNLVPRLEVSTGFFDVFLTIHQMANEDIIVNYSLHREYIDPDTRDVFRFTLQNTWRLLAKSTNNMQLPSGLSVM